MNTNKYWYDYTNINLRFKLFDVIEPYEKCFENKNLCRTYFIELIYSLVHDDGVIPIYNDDVERLYMVLYKTMDVYNKQNRGTPYNIYKIEPNEFKYRNLDGLMVECYKLIRNVELLNQCCSNGGSFKDFDETYKTKEKPKYDFGVDWNKLHEVDYEFLEENPYKIGVSREMFRRVMKLDRKVDEENE